MLNSQDVHHPRTQVPAPPPSRASLPTPSQPPRGPFPRRHHRIRWTIVTVAILGLLLLGAGGWVAYRAISVINTKKLDGSKLSFFQQLTHIVTSGGDKLQGETDDRVNILLLGYGGPGHDGPYLTDTMMVASVQPSTKKVSLISIPRDLVVNIPGYDYRKINSVLSFGRDQKYPGGGEAFAVSTVRDLLNIPIQYYARVDFDGFTDVIDQVDGVTINVERAFSDFQYPDNAYGYDPISFKAGEQAMSGETALKFSRSRHGNNGEGGDFARAARQQKVIVALKEKLLSFGTLTNPKKISDVLGSLGSHSQTNMEVWEMIRLAKIAGSVQGDEIINKVIDDSSTGFLRAGTGSGGAFILVPRTGLGNYHDIQFLAKNIFLDGAADNEQAKIMVINATQFANLGTTMKQTLQALGLDALKAGTLTNTTVGQTILVSTKPGQYPATEQLLSLYAHATGAIDVTNWTNQTGDTTLAQYLTTPITITSNTNASTTVTPDLILVLGQDQAKPTTSASTTTSSSSANTNTKTTNTNSASTNTNTKTTNTNTKVTNTNTKSTNTNTTSTNSNSSSTTTNTSSNTNTFSSVANTNVGQ